MADEQAKRDKEEKDKRKAEVRKRLEEASRAKKAKKGFMTPERKKKLRLLLRKKAADELKKEQERKAEEKKNTINTRCGQPKPLDGVNEATLQAILKEYHTRVYGLEDAKYDLEFIVRSKDYEINELNMQVNDLRGKFVKPALRKVSKFDGQLAKMKKLEAKANEMNLRTSLKSVGNKNFKMEEDEKEKPQWALGKGKEGHEHEAADAIAEE